MIPPPRTGGLRALLRLAGPVILARIGIMAMGLTDAVVVGRFSTQQLAFHALGWAPTMVVLTSSIGLLAGVQVKAAQRLGEGRRGEVGAVLRRGLKQALWISLIVTVGLLACGPAFLHAIGLEAELAAGAGRALRVFALSMPLYLLAVALSLWLEALGRPGPGMVFMWLANGLNLALNLLLVPGVFGLPALGAIGAGWATFGSRGALLLMLAVYVWKMRDSAALGVFRRAPREPAEEVEQRRIGYGAGASQFVEAGAFAGMNIVAGWLGARETAAWAIVLNVTAIVFMVPLGLSTATAVLVGRAWGARDWRGVRRAAETGFMVAIVATGVAALIVWPGAPLIAASYAGEPALARLATAGLLLAPLFFVPDGLQVVAAQALRARDDVLVPTLTHVLSYAGVMLPLGWALAHPAGLGLPGVLWSVIVASFLAAGFLLFRFYLLQSRLQAGVGSGWRPSA